MNHILKILTLLTLGSFLFGCVKLDDYNPTNAVPSEGAIHDQATAQSALNGVYDALQVEGIITSFLLMAQVYSDVADANAYADWLHSWDALETDPHGAQISPYRGFYNTINAANNLLEALPQIGDPAFTKEDRNNMKAEALFIRSLCYFYLINTFGDVPLVLTPTKEADASLNVATESVEVIYDTIVSNLLKAEELLDIDQLDTRRVNVNAINALLARIYLYRELWIDAHDAAEKVIGNGFDLTVEYPEYFSDEVFFLEFSPSDGNGLALAYGHWDVEGDYELVPSLKIRSAFDSIDNRKEKCIAFSEDSEPFVFKYNDFGQFYFGSDPSMQIRYAEVLLIAAEANAKMGKYTEAEGYINQVRNRAGLGDTTLMASDYLDIILEERFKELCFEGPHRWYDLKRTGKAQDHIPGYQDCNDVWPIPASEFNNNTNPDFMQNDYCQ